MLQQEPSEEPCRARSVCELKLARSCVVLPSATIASTRRLGGSNSDSPPPIQRQGVSSSSRARPLFWLCQSPPLAVISASGNSACPSARSIAAKATRCFFASSPTFSAPPFKQDHLAQTGTKIKSPCSIAQRACSRVRTQGSPKAAPAPPCLLEPPSIEAQHFSLRQSSIYVGL